jgi:hypothetical protein
MKTYHVEPFNPNLGEREATGLGAAVIAQQMAEKLNRSGQGTWTFEGYYAVSVDAKPGCLGIFGGVRTTTNHYGMLVFSQDR